MKSLYVFKPCFFLPIFGILITIDVFFSCCSYSNLYILYKIPRSSQFNRTSIILEIYSVCYGLLIYSFFIRIDGCGWLNERKPRRRKIRGEKNALKKTETDFIWCWWVDFSIDHKSSIIFLRFHQINLFCVEAPESSMWFQYINWISVLFTCTPGLNSSHARVISFIHVGFV